MSASVVDRLVAATLYEGYILYPYRPSSVKNRVRWTFGGVYPHAYSEASGGSEPATAQTECLLRDSGSARIDVSVRFLQVVTRSVMRLERAVAELDDQPHAAMEPVAELHVGDSIHRSWEEAIEQTIDCGTQQTTALLDHELSVVTVIPESSELEPLRDADGLVVGALRRTREMLTVEVTLEAERCATDLVRVRVAVRNASSMDVTRSGDREHALKRSLVSTHAVLVCAGGRWLSLADPPEDAREAASRCVNTGMWPVLVGEPGVDDTILASPIVLEDHPQVAPESAGDLFDATEIDEILSLRILTLTGAEKAEMRAADARARALLERTESLTSDDLMRMHGVIRDLRPASGERS